MRWLLLIALLWVSPVWAVDTYYVDATGGDDNSVDPTDPNTPWQTISKVNTPGLTFNPGDNIYFKRGERWEESLEPPDSGDPNTGYITFGAYGSDSTDPIISGGKLLAGDVWTQYSGDIYYATLPIQAGDAVYNGIQLTSNDPNWATLGLNQWDWVGVDPNRIYANVGEDPDIGGTFEAHQRAQSIKPDGKSYLRFENIITQLGTRGINVRNSQYITIDNIEARWHPCNGVHIWSGGAGYVTVSNSYIHHLGFEPPGYSCKDGIKTYSGNAGNNIFEYNEIGPNISTAGSHGIYDIAQDTIFRYNYIHGMDGASMKLRDENSEYYYNIGINPGSGCFTNEEVPGDQVMAGNSMHNNTCLGGGTDAATDRGFLWIKDAVPFQATASVKNNLYDALGEGGYMYHIDGGEPNASYAFDYNIGWDFDPNDGGVLGGWGEVDTTVYTTIGDYRPVFGHDQNSLEADPLLTDPNMADITGAIPMRHSPAIYAGTPLGYTRDYFGAAIRDPNHPTIGAVEVWPKVW